MYSFDNKSISLDPPRFIQIDTLDELETWLNSKNVDTSYWGRGETKSVESLFIEIMNGETRLQDDPPLRITLLVQVLIRRGKLVLVETEQELHDKRRRVRNYPLGEKVQTGESCYEAVLRGLREELGVWPQQVKFLDSLHPREEMETSSQSYPGLKTRYVMHTVEVEVEGLPDRDFVTQESSAGKDDTVRSHHWSWQSFDEG